MSKYLLGVVSVLLCPLAFAQRPPTGVPPRSAPADYRAHLTVAGVTYAASVVPADEVKHAFAFDISKGYVVFEVALYPQTGSSMNLNPDGFVVRPSPKGDPVRPADAATIASAIQQKNLPPRPSNVSPVVVSTEVGYESGRDSSTGQRSHGTYTAVGVGVGGAGMPPLAPAPGGYPQDRELLERQLWAKSLSASQIRQPTAGYLYFPSSLLKKAGKNYQLEYLGPGNEPVLNGGPSSQPVALQIPAKSR